MSTIGVRNYVETQADPGDKRPASPEVNSNAKHRRLERELVKVQIFWRGSDTPRADRIALIRRSERLPDYGKLQRVRISEWLDDENEERWTQTAAQLEGFYAALGVGNPNSEISDEQVRHALDVAEASYGPGCIIRGVNWAACYDMPLFFETGNNFESSIALPANTRPPEFESDYARPQRCGWQYSPTNLWSYLFYTPRYVLFNPATQELPDGVSFISLLRHGDFSTENNRMVVYRDQYRYKSMYYLLDPITLYPGVICEWNANAERPKLKLENFYLHAPRSLIEGIAKKARDEPQFQSQRPSSILAKRGMLFVEMILSMLQRVYGGADLEYEDIWTGAPFEFKESELTEAGIRTFKALPKTVKNGETYVEVHPNSAIFQKFLTRDGIRRWLSTRLNIDEDMEDSIDRLQEFGYYGLFFTPKLRTFSNTLNNSRR